MKGLLASLIALVQWVIGSAAFLMFANTPKSEENAVILAVSFCLTLLIVIPFSEHAQKYWEGVLGA